MKKVSFLLMLVFSLANYVVAQESISWVSSTENPDPSTYVLSSAGNPNNPICRSVAYESVGFVKYGLCRIRTSSDELHSLADYDILIDPRSGKDYDWISYTAYESVKPFIVYPVESSTLPICRIQTHGEVVGHVVNGKCHTWDFSLDNSHEHVGFDYLISLSTVPDRSNALYVQPKLSSSITSQLEGITSCQSFSADTKQYHGLEDGDHHQSLEVSHKWNNGNRTIFISHSETDDGDKGEILAFRSPLSMWNNVDDVIDVDETMDLISVNKITEQHPSGMAWLPFNSNYGYLFIASEYEKKIRVRYYDSDKDRRDVGDIDISSRVTSPTDVWLVTIGKYIWLFVHDMNRARGAAYKALTQQLFRYGIQQEGEIDLTAFKFVNSYTSPADTGCEKSLGQNAQLVQDSNDNWYVVHLYTSGSGICGDNLGSNIVKAYPAFFDSNGKFSISNVSRPTAEKDIGYAPGYYGKGGDGAAGFRVNSKGWLIVYTGAQFSKLYGFNYKSALEECH